MRDRTKPTTSEPSQTQGRLGDPLARETLRAAVALRSKVALTAIALVLVLSWASVFLAGGSGVLVPHLYYVPILLAAIRFGPPAALLVSIVAALLAGPLTYDDVAALSAQEPAKWLTRAVFFIGIGQLMAWLVGPSLHNISAEVREIAMRFEIRRALADAQFELHYQPVYSVQNRQHEGVEALIRWHHPERGMVLPAEFIPVAEGSDLIHEISDFVIDEACRQCAEWREWALAHHREPWYVAINLSAHDLDRSELIRKVQQALDRYSLPPELLHLELTESLLAIDGAELQLLRLKRMGLRIALDDFGTGYSSLSYLSRFPLDRLKIDRSLVSQLDGKTVASEKLAHGMVLLARSIGTTTTAEGVEKADQFRTCESLEFDCVQGYFFSRPVTAEHIPVLMLMTHPAKHDRKSSSCTDRRR